MKLLYANIVLFCFVVIGLTGIYLGIEKKESEIIAKAELGEGPLLNTHVYGQLQEIRGELFEIQLQKSLHLKNSPIPVSQKKFNDYLSALAKLRVKYPINFEPGVTEGAYLGQHPVKLYFIFDKEEVTFTLGEKLRFDQSFYVQVEELKAKTKNIFVVVDSAPIEGVYADSEEYKSDIHYLKVRSLFSIPETFFYDMKILSSHTRDNFEKNLKMVQVKSFRNKKFDVLFSQLTTVPAPMLSEGQGPMQVVFQNFRQRLLELEAEDVLTNFKPKELNDLIGTVLLQFHTGNEELWSLYRNWGKIKGPFVLKKGTDVLYKIPSHDTDVFTIHLQDFWDKRLVPDVQRLTLSFPNENKEIDLLVEKQQQGPNRFKLLRVNYDGKGLRPEQNQLAINSENLQALTDLATHQASSIDVLDKEELAKIATEKNKMLATFDGKKFWFIEGEGRAEAIDLERKVRWEYFSTGKTLLRPRSEQFVRLESKGK